jgi:CHASE3 domain sensor protein
MVRFTVKNPWLSLLFGVALAFVWGVMALAHSYDRGLAKVNDSFIQGFMIVDYLDVIVDALARLSVDQEAFLSTGDRRFEDGVIESAQTFGLDLDRLNSLAARSKLQRSFKSLSRTIDQVLSSVAESNEIRDVRGRVAAVAFFDSKEAAIADAKAQAERLKIEITGCVTDRIRSARSPSALFEDFFYGAPVGSGLVQKQSLLAVKQKRRILWVALPRISSGWK